MSPPLVVPSLGLCPESETSSGTGLSTCLTGLTSTPAHISWDWNAIPLSAIPFSQTLSHSPPFQVLVLGRRIPMALRPSALCPIWLEIGNIHFKADYYYSLRKSWEQGHLLSDISPHFVQGQRRSHGKLVGAAKLNLPIWLQWEILNPSPQSLLL